MLDVVRGVFGVTPDVLVRVTEGCLDQWNGEFDVQLTVNASQMPESENRLAGDCGVLMVGQVRADAFGPGSVLSVECSGQDRDHQLMRVITFQRSLNFTDRKRGDRFVFHVSNWRYADPVGPTIAFTRAGS